MVVIMHLGGRAGKAFFPSSQYQRQGFILLLIIVDKGGMERWEFLST